MPDLTLTPAATGSLGTSASTVGTVGGGTSDFPNDVGVEGDLKVGGGSPWFDVSHSNFGAVPGGADCLAAVNAAVAAMPTLLGGTLFFPPGEWWFSGPITIDKPVKIVGAGAGTTSSRAATVLAFNAGQSGIILGENARKSHISDLSIVSASSGAGTDDGLTIRANQCLIENVTIETFGRYGFYLDGSGGTNNCNKTKLDQCRALQNRSHGFYASGTNSNVIKFDGCDAGSNLGWGYLNEGDTNVYIGCHAEGNTLGAFRDDGSSSGYFFPYVEPGTGNNVTFNGGYHVWVVGLFTDPTITDNTTTTTIVRRGGHEHVRINDATNIVLGSTTGTKIGTSGTQKLAFYNTTPIVRPTGVAVSAAGIHAALVSLGLITA